MTMQNQLGGAAEWLNRVRVALQACAVQLSGAHLLKCGKVPIEVVKPGQQRKDGDSYEEEPRHGAQPWSVWQTHFRRIDCPGRQPALI